MRTLNFQVGEIIEAVLVATSILTSTLAHETGGMCVGRHVSWVGTTGTACTAEPVLCPTAYSALVFPTSTGRACQLCLQITSL
jgi:hypothetical protein